MIKFILRRIKHYIPILIFVIIFTFFITHLMPGDPVRTMLGDRASQEQVDAMKGELNLDKPILEQFQIWIKGVLKLDFGESIFWKQPIDKILMERLEPTLILSLIGIILSVSIGVPMGLMSAKYYKKPLDGLFSILSLISISLPAFVLAIIFINLFGVNLRLFPTSGYERIAVGGLGNSIYQLLLPGIVLGIMYSGQITRMTKNTILDVMQEDYLRTARAQGIKESKVINLYAFFNILSPLVVIIGFTFAGLFGGSAVIEQTFNIPGIGNLLITAILNRDYPVIQAGLLLISVIFFLVNMMVDIINILINPKVRFDSYEEN